MGAFNGAGRIVTNGLMYLIDPGNKRSYSGSGATINDLSPNQITTTLVGSPTYDDVGAIVLNGTSQYMTLTWPSVVSSWSMSFWINVISLPGTTEKEVIAITGNSFLLLIGLNASIWKWAFWNGSVTLLTNDAVQTGVWQNMTVTANGTVVQWYLNGVNIVGHSPYATPFNTGTTWIGNNPDATNRYLNAKMSHIAFYNRVLSQAEVTQNFEALRERYKV